MFRVRPMLMFLVVLLSFESGVGAQEEPRPPSGESRAQPQDIPAERRESASYEYRVGPRDVLVLTFWDQPDLSGRFRVEEDGYFTFAMVGRVRAAGLTLREIEQQLRKALSNGFFKNPQLSLSIDEYGSQRFFVLGEVRQ